MFVTKHLYQNDDTWKNIPLGNSKETIGSWGCLLTSVTMILNGIGYNETPETVNEKMKKVGGFNGGLFIPSSLPQVWANCVYKDMQGCETVPAPIAYIDAAVAAGKPVILQVDSNKQAGMQSHFVLVKEKKGDDYSIYDPYKLSGDSPDKEVLLTSRYKYNGGKLATEIFAVLWFDNYGINTQQPPKETKLPLPAEKFVLYVAEDDLALRAEGLVTGYLWKRLMKNAELIALEPKAQVLAKIGKQGQWIQVQDPTGKQGFVAAWYLSDKKVSDISPVTPATSPSPSTSPAPSSSPTPSRSPSPVPVPAGALALLPTTMITLRAKPLIANDNVIRYIDATEQLISLETADQTIPKIGVQNQWIKVKDANNREGYVAAWYIKYAGGSTAQENSTSSPSSGPVKVKTTAELVTLRNQPIVSEATVIKRVPIGYEFTIAEPGGESKIGKNDQWIKVKDATSEGYIAAWFVTQ